LELDKKGSLSINVFTYLEEIITNSKEKLLSLVGNKDKGGEYDVDMIMAK
jgi:hypothetical protein